MEDDVVSVFTYEDSEEARPDSFNLTALTSVANELFSPKRCALEKIAEGGFHKVYNVLTTDGEELRVVARVANPSFPRDKLESEVATLKFVAEKTSVPVPKVVAWDSDAANGVGAEYMFLSKIPGVTAHKAWPDLSIDVKKNMVRQVAKYMLELWRLRFDSLGSLYLADNETGYRVGPIIDSRFYQKFDGVPRTKISIDLSAYRGPFSTISSYLASGLHAELKLYAERREDLIIEADGNETHVESGKRAMEMALPLCDIYPGDRPISEDAKEPITLDLDDFILPNIMINPMTGDVHGLIDFEGAITAPDWFCAEIPPWLRDDDIDLAEDYASFRFDISDEDDGDGEHRVARVHSTESKCSCTNNPLCAKNVAAIIKNCRNKPPTEEAILQKEFLETMKSLDESGSWTRAYEAGKPYGEFAMSVKYFITSWGNLSRGLWVESALRWLKKHPTEGTPGNIESWYPDIRSSWK